jgi:hypothetical protein
MVGAIGFEPTTPCAQGRCATRLRYAPTSGTVLILNRQWRTVSLEPTIRMELGKSYPLNLAGFAAFLPVALCHEFRGQGHEIFGSRCSGSEFEVCTQEFDRR